MGLKGDLQEVTTIWEQSTWRVKALLALSVFLASGSIASLSDTVFRWKGFVADAVALYERYVSGQLHQALQLLFSGVEIPTGVSHLLILSALYIGANFRVAVFASPASKSRRIAYNSMADYVGSTLGLLLGMHYAGGVLEEGVAFGIFVSSAALSSIRYWRAGGASRILWFAWLLGPFVLTGLVAAVTAGWNRTV